LDESGLVGWQAGYENSFWEFTVGKARQDQRAW
jgi:hypothetical protein